jgi:hypothetical protein
MIRNEKCEVLDKQNFEPKYRRVYDIGVFPTVLVFSYGQINPTVKISWLGCTQFVVPLLIRLLKNQKYKTE